MMSKQGFTLFFFASSPVRTTSSGTGGGTSSSTSSGTGTGGTAADAGTD